MTSVPEGELAPRPDHVPAALVRDFNIYDVPGSAEDVQAAYAVIQQANPDIFWTPHNGGHWVATRSKDIIAMQRDYHHFSHKHIVLPPCRRVRRARFLWRWTRPSMRDTGVR